MGRQDDEEIEQIAASTYTQPEIFVSELEQGLMLGELSIDDVEAAIVDFFRKNRR